MYNIEVVSSFEKISRIVIQLRNERYFSSDDVNELKQQENLLSSNMSINRKPHQNSNKLKLSSGIRMFGMHIMDENITNEHVASIIYIAT